jgi:hypothetical protein
MVTRGYKSKEELCPRRIDYCSIADIPPILYRSIDGAIHSNETKGGLVYKLRKWPAGVNQLPCAEQTATAVGHTFYLRILAAIGA